MVGGPSMGWRLKPESVTVSVMVSSHSESNCMFCWRSSRQQVLLQSLLHLIICRMDLAARSISLGVSSSRLDFSKSTMEILLLHCILPGVLPTSPEVSLCW